MERRGNDAGDAAISEALLEVLPNIRQRAIVVRRAPADGGTHHPVLEADVVDRKWRKDIGVSHNCASGAELRTSSTLLVIGPARSRRCTLRSPFFPGHHLLCSRRLLPA